MNAKLKANLKGVMDAISYEIELVAQLMIVFTAGIIYGIMEAKFINTGVLELSVFGHWSWYHVGLVALMVVSSFALALSRIQSLLLHRKKYILLMCLGSVPLALMIEDITWFIVEEQPVARDEWTMIAPGWGINLGFTWIPLWWIAIVAFSTGMFIIAGRLAKKSNKKELRDGR